MIQLKLSACLVIFCMLSASLPAAPPPSTESESDGGLQKLIGELEENEALYQNLKLKLHARYEQPPGQVDPKKQAWHKSELTLIVQGDKYRQEKRTEGRFRQAFAFPTNKPYHHFNSGTDVASQVFDGETLRQFYLYDHAPGLTTDERQQSGRGEIGHEYERMENLLRPHRMLLEYGMKIPLSTWLKGNPAIADSPGLPNYNDGRSYQVQLLGEEQVQGLDCVKVQIDQFRPNGKPSLRNILWLARERNLLPVQADSYQLSRSTEIPQSKARVDAWQEVRPGVWFPRKFHIDRLNWLVYARQHKEEVGWRKEFLVQSVELDPKLPENTFTELEFPAGIEVDGGE